MKKFSMKEYRKPFLSLDLQMFAGDPPADPPADPPTPPADPPADPPKFDDILKDKGLQSEFDKRITKALETAKTKWEADAESRILAAKTEAEKLSKLTADQKAEYERQKQADDLAKREGDITRRELRATALETLAEKGLPTQLADILVFTDAEATNKSIESVEKAFRAAVEAGVNERLKGGAPRGGGKGGGQADDFGKRLADYAKKDEGLEKARETYFK